MIRPLPNVTVFSGVLTNFVRNRTNPDGMELQPHFPHVSFLPQGYRREGFEQSPPGSPHEAKL